MKKLFDKNEVIFAVILIVIYVAGSTLMVQLSEMIGIGFLAEAAFGIVLFAVLPGLIAKYGLPQDWNADGRYGPERYIETHIWSAETVGRYFGG